MVKMMTAIKSKDDKYDINCDCISVQFHLLFVSVELSGLVLELHGIIELLSLFSTDNYPALIREQFWVITEIWWLTLSEFRVAETQLVFGQLQSKHGQCICRAEALIPFCQIPNQALD